MWSNFCSLLRELLQLHQQLLVLSNEKKDILVAVDVQRLEEITKEEENVIIEVGKLEAKRRQAVIELGKSLHLFQADMTLAHLIEDADASLKPELIELNNRLNTTLMNLKTANEINTKLLEQSLSLIDYNMNLMTQSAASPVYAAGGKQHSDRVSGIFDKKV